MPLAICQTCHEPLHRDDKGVLVHRDGGFYVIRCGVCGWRGAPPATLSLCPRCGAASLRDDHCACPKVS
jgi:hypothetical protein